MPIQLSGAIAFIIVRAACSCMMVREAQSRTTMRFRTGKAWGHATERTRLFATTGCTKTVRQGCTSTGREVVSSTTTTFSTTEEPESRCKPRVLHSLQEIASTATDTRLYGSPTVE